jgi:hypothetical protein
MIRPVPLLAVFAALVAVACTDFEAASPDAGADAAGKPSNDGGAGEGGGNCGPANCPGCCFNGICESGTAFKACGSGGAVCSQCVTPQLCRPEQKCGLDPDQLWFVQPVAATIATTNNGSAWDFGTGTVALPDPFVRLRCSLAPVQTSRVDDTTSPTWTTGGCSLKARDLLTGALELGVFDYDITSDDTIMATASFPVTETDLLAGEKTIASKPNVLSLRVTLKPQ